MQRKQYTEAQIAFALRQAGPCGVNEYAGR